jgi:hypothetical protein
MTMGIVWIYHSDAVSIGRSAAVSGARFER